VSANWPTGEADGGTRESRFQPAGAAAAVAAVGVAVVTGFAGSNPLVAADFFRTDRARSASGAGIASLDGARRGTTVVRSGVTVVARLAHDVANDAVSAELLQLAGLTGGRADVAGFELAVRGAPITRLRVAIVAILAGIDGRIRTEDHGDRALAAGGLAGVAGFDRAAVRAAAVAGLGIPVVARLTRANHAIAAYDGRDADLPRQARIQSRRRAFAVRFKLATSVAAIAGNQVAVVALLARIENAVAARLVERTHGSDAGVATFLLAGRRAAVAREGVSVVAGFAKLRDPVSARGRSGRRDTRLTEGRARVTALYRTLGRATVAILGVSVVAAFVRAGDPVTAEQDAGTGLAGRRADVTRFDLAGAVAAIAALGVSVVADFASLEDAVATRAQRSEEHT